MRMPWTRFATVPLLLIPLTACDLVVPTSYRLEFQLIEANGPQGADPTEVVEELRKKLPFDGYSLKGKFSVAVKPDAEFSQSMGTATDGPRIVYNFKGGFKTNVNIEGGEERDTLRLRVERGVEPVLETTVGIRPGQTLVLGSVPRPEEATLLIVVRMVEG